MSRPVLTVENISKAYRIGEKEEIPDTFIGALKGIATAPLRNFHRLRRLNTFGTTAVTDPDNSQPATRNSHAQVSPLAARHSPLPTDTLWALRDVSFDVNEGDVVGIIGRNGAGKSTLLKILSRITEPTSGRVVIRGRVSSLLEVGTGFHPELTGRENIYMNGTILGMKKKEIDRKFDEIVDFSGVEKFLDTPVKRYSSGMQVRLAFAVAAHLEPEILIIDEVLAVGDAEFQKKCLGKMQDVASEGRTVLFVSHNMAAVQSLCSRGISLAQGCVAVDASASTSIDRYLQGMKPQSGHRHQLDGNLHIIKEVSVHSCNVDATNAMHEGETLIIVVNFDATRMPPEASIAIGIDNSLNQRMLTLPVHPQETHGPDWVRGNRIACTVRQCPLSSGTYQLTVICRARGEVIERQSHILQFDIQPNPLFIAPGRYKDALCVARSEWCCG